MGFFKRSGRRASGVVSFRPDMPIAELLPNRHVHVAGVGGSGVSTLLGLLASAALREGFEVTWIGRSPRNAVPGGWRLRASEDGKPGYMEISSIWRPRAEGVPDPVQLALGVSAERAHAHSLILLDHLSISTHSMLSDVMPLLRAGARVVTSAHEPLSVVTRDTCDIILRLVSEPQGLPGAQGWPTMGEAQCLLPGEGLMRRPGSNWARIRIRPDVSAVKRARAPYGRPRARNEALPCAG